MSFTEAFSPQERGAGSRSERKDFTAELDRLFDGKGPKEADPAPVVTGAALLARAKSRGVSLEDAGKALQDSQTPQESALRLMGLGLLEAHEAVTQQGLERLWHEASVHVAAAFPVDRSLPVASLVVRARGVTYHIHGVLHGILKPVRPAAVRALAQALESAGLPLYAEERLGSFYRFSYGTQLLDHRAAQGLPVALATQPAVRAKSPAARVLPVVLSLLSWTIPAALVLSHPGSAAGWTALAAVAAVHVLLWTSFLPLLRVFFHGVGLLAALRAQDEDLAHYWHARARGLYRLRFDLGLLRRLELPARLKLALGGSVAARSRAMAEAVASDAKALGLSEVHILVGVNHAQEVAQALSEPKVL